MWAPYPRHEGTSKAAGFRKFSGLDDADQSRVIATIPAYARRMVGKEAQFICHLEFYISRRIFDTIAPLKVAPAAGAPAIDWARVMRLYAATGNWNLALGPAPGGPGCKVPPEFLK